MKTNRLIIGVVTVGLMLAVVPAQARGVGRPDWLNDQQLTEKFSKTVPLAKGGSFDLTDISGDIVITGGAGDQVVIDATKHGRTADDLKALQIDVTATGGRVEVRAEYSKERRNINASVEFTVTVPRGAIVNVHSVSGDLKLSNIDGALRAETVSGDVTITSAGQLEAAKTVSGNVTVESAGSSGDVTVGSVSGDVKLRALKVRGIDLNSVSGDVTLADVTCERIKASSVSGEITFGGPLAKGGRYVIQSHSGDITITLADKMGFELNASTFSGDIHSDVELTAKVGGDADQTGRSGRPGRARRQSMHGTFGDGSAVLDLSAFSGDIKIVKK